MAGLALHGMLDGVALANAHGHATPLAVVLHRLPEGLTLWWLLRPTYGPRWTAAAIAAPRPPAAPVTSQVRGLALSVALS